VACGDGGRVKKTKPPPTIAAGRGFLIVDVFPLGRDGAVDQSYYDDAA
jgi:hypothetical protein